MRKQPDLWPSKIPTEIQNRIAIGSYMIMNDVIDKWVQIIEQHEWKDFCHSLLIDYNNHNLTIIIHLTLLLSKPTCSFLLLTSPAIPTRFDL